MKQRLIVLMIVAIVSLAAAGLVVAASASGRVSVSVADGETISIEPASQVADVGDPITANVVASGVTDMVGFQCDLSFDNAVLAVTDVDLGDGLGNWPQDVDSLATTRETPGGAVEQLNQLVDPSATLLNEINADGGLRFATSNTVPFTDEKALDGTGTLAIVAFNVIGDPGAGSILDLNDCSMSVGLPPTTIVPIEVDGEVTAPTKLADLKIVDLSLEAPETVPAGVTFTLSGNATLHNNGPFGPVEVEEYTLTGIPPDMPDDCTLGTGVAAFGPLHVSEDMSVGFSQQVTCSDSDPSSNPHVFTWDACVEITREDLSDPDPSNDCSSASVEVTIGPPPDTADLRIVALSLEAPETVPAGVAFTLSGSATLHNDGPFGPVEDYKVTGIPPDAPGDCTLGIGAAAGGPLPVSVDVPFGFSQEVTCSDSDPSSNPHVFTWDACVEITREDLSDPDPTNDCSSATVEVTIAPDSDGDGVPDDQDQCPGTPAGETVDANGCSESQLDDDDDGVSNADDQCPGTPAGETVDANGCSESQLDDDDDGVSNADDQCPGTPAGEAVDANGCSDSQVDEDGDGVCDPDAPSAGPSVCTGSDLCPDTPPGTTVDADGCAAPPPPCIDLNSDGRVDGRDVSIVARALFTAPGDKRWNAGADVNGDGLVNLVDLFLVLSSLHDPDCR